MQDNADTLLAVLRVGDTLREYGLGSPWHFRGVVDGRLVIRYWSRKRQSWAYKVISTWELRFYSPDQMLRKRALAMMGDASLRLLGGRLLSVDLR